MVKRVVLSMAAAAMLLSPMAAGPANFYTYVGWVEQNAALIAWGVTEGRGNTIGRESVPMGEAELLVAGRTIRANRNWAIVEGLEPDREYPYELRMGGAAIGAGSVRTLPAQTDKLAFFVIGDWGNGSSGQYRIAKKMYEEFARRNATDNPIRFVLSTGDNIYSRLTFWLSSTRTGKYDSDWEPTFFEPYAPLIRHVPFYSTLGNHDGNESESRADLMVYLDNFFFPGREPARYYQFSVGGFADFFALDTTTNTLEGDPSPAIYEKGSEQRLWLEKALAGSRAPWKIAYFHHPPFNAGPGHGAREGELKHFTTLFEQYGVPVAFNGHEHNFQITDPAKTGGITYVISGSGGELRSGNVLDHMEAAGIAGWAPVRQFLLVEIEGDTMRITPMADTPVTVFGPDRKPLPTPFEVHLAPAGVTPTAFAPAVRR